LASGTPMIGSAMVIMAIASPPSRDAASAMSNPTMPGITQAAANTSRMFQSCVTP
jgi:hypothetical protein